MAVETMFVLFMTFGAFDGQLVVPNIPTQKACVEKAKEIVEKYRLVLSKDSPEKWRTAKWKCKVIYYRFSEES